MPGVSYAAAGALSGFIVQLYANSLRRVPALRRTIPLPARLRRGAAASLPPPSFSILLAPPPPRSAPAGAGAATPAPGSGAAWEKHGEGLRAGAGAAGYAVPSGRLRRWAINGCRL